MEVEAGDAGVFLVLVQLQRGEVELFSQTGALGTHWQREWWPDQLAGLAKTCNDTFAVSQEFDFHLQCFCMFFAYVYMFLIVFACFCTGMCHLSF